jgi:hypothetical protein
MAIVQRRLLILHPRLSVIGTRITAAPVQRRCLGTMTAHRSIRSARNCLSGWRDDATGSKSPSRPRSTSMPSPPRAASDAPAVVLIDRALIARELSRPDPPTLDEPATAARLP